MTYVFGIDLPVIETMLIITLFFIIGVAFMIWQMLSMKKHIGVLESMTLDIRRYEEDEGKELQRFEQDISNFESSEAEFFLAKMLPSLTKLQNYAANRLLNGATTGEVLQELTKKKVKQDVAFRIVNNVGFYLQYFGKMPQKQNEQHIKAAAELKA